MKAAIYSRFSTDKQTESSIADQVRVCTEYATKEGWTITHRFEDQGISGAAIGNRPGVQALMAAGTAREYDVLLVMELSRLSRSQADTHKMLDRLTFKGVRVIGIQDGYDSARRGHKMQSGLSGIMGEQFREMVSDKTRTALESRARTGRATGGRTFGYTSKNAIVPDEVPLVLEIFTRYAQGESMRAIGMDLNSRGIGSPRGGLWTVGAIKTILHNERYTGRLVWNKTVKRKHPDSGKRHTFARPESEWVTAIREDLRIVPRDLWEQVRARDVPAAYASGNARPKYPLSGLLVCGECGRPMVISGGVNKRGYGSRRYICTGHREHGDMACKNSMTVSRALVEESLINPIREKLLADDAFVKSLEALANIGSGKSDPKTGDLAYEPDGARGYRDSGERFYGGSQLVAPGTDGDDTHGRDTLLASKIAAIESAAAIGALSQREAASRCAALRAEHERTNAHTLPTDEGSILANAERLRAALVSAATDALRDALRRTLGTVRCRPVVDDGPPYLMAEFDGGSEPLLDWLYTGSPGWTALVPRAGIEPAT